MQASIKSFTKSAISDMIENTSSRKKINKLLKTHKAKLHFILIRYRIFGGLLQSMNIQFGNFIEKLLHIIVENESKLTIQTNISGKRNIKLSMTRDGDKLIDNYITDCQNNSYNDTQLLENFTILVKTCLKYEQEKQNKEISIRHDIDVLFYNDDKKYYYLEVKYNDNQDTGIYADINRKFIKSYIGICNQLNIYDIQKFKPILYYLTKKRLKGNICLQEKEVIHRGDKLFNEFFHIKYAELDVIMSSIGYDNDINELFYNLYTKIRNNIEIEYTEDCYKLNCKMI